jgi:hypothetical protein
MSVPRQKLAYSVYLASLAVAMAGWAWALYEGFEWVLGA